LPAKHPTLRELQSRLYDYFYQNSLPRKERENHVKNLFIIKKHKVSGANSNTIEMVKMQIIDQFENGEKKT